MSDDERTERIEPTDTPTETPTQTPTGTQDEEEPRRSGLHPLQTGYLVAGLLAIGGALQWLLTDRGVMELGDGSVALSVILVAAGTVGLVASLGKALRHR